MSQGPLRLGTRRSLLARVQSTAVARALERAHPGVQVELVGIETRGDRIQRSAAVLGRRQGILHRGNRPALPEGQVDLTVHSYKDLSLDRTPAFESRRGAAARASARYRHFCARCPRALWPRAGR